MKYKKNNQRSVNGVELPKSIKKESKIKNHLKNSSYNA